MVMKTWTIQIHMEQVSPTFVKKFGVAKWRTILTDLGFGMEHYIPAHQDDHTPSAVRWKVWHPTNEYALEELLLMYGNELLPATIKEIENV